MNDFQIKQVFEQLADLVHAYEVLTELSDEHPQISVFKQLNHRFRSLLDLSVEAGGLD
jgi:hypothetical protein